VGELRVGQGIDVHPFAAESSGRPLVLAGVHVPGAPGLDGHSDADVVAHAVADALLGAVAAGDLGGRFGVDDPAVAGADSLGLLGVVVADLAADGWRVGNVDCTVLAQRPRLAHHRDAMRANLAAVLAVDVGAVSVKATTTDRLGAIGRAEGVACTAVCTVVR
jgi:2-C-methyl-D-erythritol 2,4-cyclodiphosphate synthase